MTEEESKAIQEVAKATGKGIDAFRGLGVFIKDVFGETLIEYGRSYLDRAKLYRYENALKIIDRVQEIHNQRKIEGKPIPIPPRYAIPLIERASIEDEEEIQKLWAGLIANATDPAKRLQIKKIYIEILSNLEPLDARILEYLDQNGATANLHNSRRIINLPDISLTLEIPSEELTVSVHNLSRLGLLLAENQQGVNWMAGISQPAAGIDSFNPDVNVFLSMLAVSIMKACTE